MSKFSISKRLNSFKFAFQGIKLLFLHEHNAWIHLAAIFVVLSCGVFFNISSIEWISVIFAIGIVLTAEAFNTAIEQIANFIQPEQDQKIGHIKDLAAGGVLISAISSLIVGIIIFLPKFIYLINS
jgi:diacylglycerol kinase